MTQDSKGALPENPIYLDNNATSPPLPEVVDLVASLMSSGLGNPSSHHRAGRAARDVMRRARLQVASFVGVAEDDVVFTSGATEANNLVLSSLLAGSLAGFRLVTSAVEHSSVLQSAAHLESRGVPVSYLPVDQDGLVDPAELAERILPGRTLVSVQWANNETGVLQPVRELAVTAKAQGALFHTDAVQAIGKVPVDLTDIPVDLLSLSGHKLHGPVGVGALVGPGLTAVTPAFLGGSQERSIRPGTENVPGMAGLGLALELRSKVFDEVARHTGVLRDRFEDRLRDLGLVDRINGGGVQRLPNTSSVTFQDVDGEALVLRLDQAGVICSQSSACTSGRPEPSYVLRQLGLSEREAYGTIRFGFSQLNRVSEIDHAALIIKELHARLSQFAVA